MLLVEPGPFRTDWGGRSLQQSPNVIADYQETAGKRRREIPVYSGTQPGDPARAAEAVIKTLQSPNPPHHLVLGRQGLEVARNQLNAMLQEFEMWKETSLSADYPATVSAG